MQKKLLITSEVDLQTTKMKPEIFSTWKQLLQKGQAIVLPVLIKPNSQILEYITRRNIMGEMEVEVLNHIIQTQRSSRLGIQQMFLRHLIYKIHYNLSIPVGQYCMSF